ncbi:MAG: hypothetical protein ACLSEX_13975, partial [Blautia sp.]
MTGSLSTGKMGPVTEKTASATGTMRLRRRLRQPCRRVSGTVDGQSVQGSPSENTYTTPTQQAASDSASPTQGTASGNGVSTPTQESVPGTVSGTGDVPETSPITVQEDNGTKGEITTDDSQPNGKGEGPDTSSANSVLGEKIKLVADSQELDFGSLYTGYDSKNMQLNLENQGTDALTLDSAVGGDLADVISVGEIGELKSGESKTVNVTLKEGLGASADVYTGTLTVMNGDESAKVEVGLKVRVEEKLYKVQASPKSIDLGTLTEGY